MDSDSEISVIHVRLLDEPVPVWRPVLSKELGNGKYLIVEQSIPEFEDWEFKPGQIVLTETAVSDGDTYTRAIEVPKTV
jgi:hypothetical protein